MITGIFPEPCLDQAAHLRLVEGKSYRQIGAAMGLTKWQARDLVGRVESFMLGYSAGFKAAAALARFMATKPHCEERENAQID